MLPSSCCGANAGTRAHLLRKRDVKDQASPVVIAALGVVQILTWGSSFYLLTVRAGPISGIRAGRRNGSSASLSVGLLVAGLVSPKMGALIDARGGRPVLAGEGCSGAVIPRPLSSPAAPPVRAPEAI